jgi:dephospho-CoA kinase
MIRVAITGGIACGKSLVGEMFSDAGTSVCDADDLAHSLMVPGTTVYKGIIKEFGECILAANGDIDRQKLGKLVFSDECARLILNGLVHPAVKELLESWLDRHSMEPVAAAIVPLLYEAEMADGWDAIICVSCGFDVQLQRLKERGFSEIEARQRISAQLPVYIKMENADFVIYNNGTILMLRKQVIKVLRHILEK